jgi:acyl-CoA synthetase (AMP-forming)/AMP-acid ligase II
MKNIGVMLQQRSVVSTHLEAYVEPSTQVRASYADLNALSNKCAAVMSELGVKKGDRVALLMHNSIEFVALFYGAAI